MFIADRLSYNITVEPLMKNPPNQAHNTKTSITRTNFGPYTDLNYACIFNL